VCKVSGKIVETEGAIFEAKHHGRNVRGVLLCKAVLYLQGSMILTGNTTARH